MKWLAEVQSGHRQHVAPVLESESWSQHCTAAHSQKLPGRGAREFWPLLPGEAAPSYGWGESLISEQCESSRTLPKLAVSSHGSYGAFCNTSHIPNHRATYIERGKLFNDSSCQPGYVAEEAVECGYEMAPTELGGYLFEEGKTPKCVATVCTVPSIANGRLILEGDCGNNESHPDGPKVCKVMATYSLVCDKDFSLVGSNQVLCQQGAWTLPEGSSQYPRCAAQGCNVSSVPHITANFFDNGSLTPYNNQLTLPRSPFDCENGYSLFKPLICNGSDITENDTRCVDVNECEDGNPCGKGSVQCTNTVGSFICDCADGYYVVDIEIAPRCVDAFCYTSHIPNHRVTFIKGGKLFNDSSCQPGYVAEEAVKCGYEMAPTELGGNLFEGGKTPKCVDSTPSQSGSL